MGESLEALLDAYYVVPLCGFVNMGVPLRPALIWFFLVSYKKKISSGKRFG